MPLNDGLIGSLAGLGALAVEVLVGPPTNKVQITERGLKHAIARHTFYGPAKSTKSIFNLGESLVDLIKLADDVAPAAQANGNYVRVMTAGREIGIDRATGLPTKTYTVVTDGTGKLVTMFPGRP